jgi:hypothetical protein
MRHGHSDIEDAEYTEVVTYELWTRQTDQIQAACAAYGVETLTEAWALLDQYGDESTLEVRDSNGGVHRRVQSQESMRQKQPRPKRAVDFSCAPGLAQDARDVLQTLKLDPGLTQDLKEFSQAPWLRRLKSSYKWIIYLIGNFNLWFAIGYLFFGGIGNGYHVSQVGRIFGQIAVLITFGFGIRAAIHTFRKGEGK